MELVDALRDSIAETAPDIAHDIARDIAHDIADSEPFEDMRGRLPWPVNGDLLASFGSVRGGSGLPRQGALIAAATGQPVRAVHRGRVAYADWLRGFGLLLIVDHGDGFMSLYGHNETLVRDTGDWVESAEIIATAGDSGGYAEPSLYFEIRRDGKPVDPGRWWAESSATALVSP